MKTNLSFLFVFVATLQAFAHVPHFKRMIVFGDSLSDQGTYEVAAKPKGGGKFTTNPGKLWIEVVAERMHLPIAVNRHEGFGIPLQILGGFNYAQGAARVSTALNTDPNKGYTGRPVSEQIGYFLDEQKNFKQSDIIFVLAGANDEFANLAEVGAGHMTPEQAVKLIAQTAGDLANLVHSLTAAGAKTVVVLNLPMVEKTPMALSLDPQVQGLISAMTKTFNQVLQGQLAQNKNAHLIDFYAFDTKFNSNAAKYGIANVTNPACLIKLLPGNSSLFCSSKTLVSEQADLTYKFADSIHPATGFSKIAGEFVLSEIKKIK